MTAARHFVSVVIAAAALAAVRVSAQELPMRDPAADAIDFSEKPFQEEKVKLPPAPKAEDLIEFDAGPTRRGFEHFVDGATLSLGEDGVIRYTLVITSDAGARNVSYEGMRCKTAERKVYAYGRRDGTWSKARDQEWRSIDQSTGEGPIYILYDDFFCPGRSAVASASEAVAALKAGAHPRSSDETAERLIPLGR